MPGLLDDTRGIEGLATKADVQRFVQQILDGDPRLRPRDPAPLVTSLPAQPFNGQEVTFLADATNGILWRLKYRAGSASNYKWEVVSATPLFDEVAAVQNTAVGPTGYAALATAGPAIALPLAGDYDVEIGGRGYTNANGTNTLMSYDIGGTGAVDPDAVDCYNGAAPTAGGDGFPRRKAGLTAVTLTAKYKTPGAGVTGTWEKRWMRVRPVRVG